MLATPLALLLLLGFAASFAFSDSLPDNDDDDLPPEGEELIGTDGDDLLEGGPGDDTLIGGPGDDTLYGEAGDDLLLGGEGDDLLDGGEGNDMLDGGPGSNTLIGGMGDDTFILHDGFEAGVIDGGDEGETLGDLIDAREMTEGAEVMVRADGTGAFIRWDDGPQVIEISGIERFALGSGNDTLELHGGEGPFHVDAGAGDDLIYASQGDDTLIGGAGDDVFVLPVDFGNAIIDGGDTGETDGDALVADTGHDLVLTLSGNGTGTLTRDDATATFSGIGNFELGWGDDLADASATSEGVRIDGGGGDDTLIGGLGANVLVGGAGDDMLHGRIDDTLTGGAGADTFVLDIGLGSLLGTGAPPTVTDYTAGEDRLALTLFYPATDSTGGAFPPPVVTHEIDTDANEVRILGNDEVLAVLAGTTDFDLDDLSVTLRASSA